MTIIRAMDRSLKARLIGASVLVLVVVLVVPELLSGRKAATTETPGAADSTLNNGPTRTYTIELGKAGSPVAAGTRMVAAWAGSLATSASAREAALSRLGTLMMPPYDIEFCSVLRPGKPLGNAEKRVVPAPCRLTSSALS